MNAALGTTPELHRHAGWTGRRKNDNRILSIFHVTMSHPYVARATRRRDLVSHSLAIEDVLGLSSCSKCYPSPPIPDTLALHRDTQHHILTRWVLRKKRKALSHLYCHSPSSATNLADVALLRNIRLQQGGRGGWCARGHKSAQRGSTSASKNVVAEKEKIIFSWAGSNCSS